MDKKQKDNEPKKTYRRPEANRFHLRAEEAVLGNCKTTTIGGPVQSTCSSPAPCNAVGS